MPRQNWVSNDWRPRIGNLGRYKAVTSNSERTLLLSQSGLLYSTGVEAILPHMFVASDSTVDRFLFSFSNNVFYFVGFQNNFWLGRIWNLLYRLRHEVGFKTLTTKLIYLIVFCWPPSRQASGQLRMDNQIPGGGYWQRIGHFRVPLCLCFKASLSAKPFLWKWL